MMMVDNENRDNRDNDDLMAAAIKNQQVTDVAGVGGVATTAAGRLNALLDQLTIITISQPSHPDDNAKAGEPATDAAAEEDKCRNDTIVDQLFELMLGRGGGPKTAADFGFLEAFGVELAR